MKPKRAVAYAGEMFFSVKGLPRLPFGAKSPRVEELSSDVSWKDGRCTLTQKFLFRDQMEERPLLEKLDASMHARSTEVGLGLLKWRGGQLQAGPVPLAELGAPRVEQQGADPVVARAIGGGMLVGEQGGDQLFRAHKTPEGVIVEAVLENFAPRLPRPVYELTQAPVHRAVVRMAVEAVARDLE